MDALRWETHSYGFSHEGGLHAVILTQQKQVNCYLDHFLNILTFCCCCFFQAKKRCPSACLLEVRQKNRKHRFANLSCKHTKNNIERDVKKVQEAGENRRKVTFRNKRQEQRSSAESKSQNTIEQSPSSASSAAGGGHLGGALIKLLTQQNLPLSVSLLLSKLLGTKIQSPLHSRKSVLGLWVRGSLSLLCTCFTSLFYLQQVGMPSLLFHGCESATSNLSSWGTEPDCFCHLQTPISVTAWRGVPSRSQVQSPRSCLTDTPPVGEQDPARHHCSPRGRRGNLCN